MDADQERLNRISVLIIGGAFRVIDTLGVGLSVIQQHKISVYYAGVVVGEYAVDLMIENSVMVELKAVKALDSIHATQCMNFLKATNPRFCLLLNFGKSRLDIQCVTNGL